MMSRYIVTYVQPARQRKRMVEADTPEQAAITARRLHATTHADNTLLDVIVTQVGDDDVKKEVLDFCATCSLPIWVDDERSSFVQADAQDDSSEMTTTHASCLESV